MDRNTTKLLNFYPSTSTMPIATYETVKLLPFSSQVLVVIYFLLCFLWFLAVTTNGYFMKRSIADSNRHIAMFSSLCLLFASISIICYFDFGPTNHFLDIGVYFFLCAIYSLCIIFGLLAVKYKFQREYSALVKENRELGLPVITEREAADLIRVKQFYERNKKSTDWQRPVFTVAELERWSRCLAIAELTGQKDHDAMQQIVNEMRRTPMNFGGYGPLFNQTVQTPISTISNQVPPPNYCP